ncbi:uncharacterized protein LOC113464760 [Ceratina calcarata]|uniref:Uncharacterized protein LOC113464760 n=1 Tax=Ceratina calcarata TaxID=156304 RepID=A0AAJ7S7Q5_9HYME|nr:uncharacterized protein LOC113464760 [Ceratina calcarata]
MDQVNRCFEELKIECHEAKGEHLVGKIISIIGMLNTVIVKPHSPNILLDFGTPLFIVNTDFNNVKVKYKLLGHIDDIFGPIGEPMYSVTLRYNLKSVLNLNTYYFPDNPNTGHICVEHIINNVSKNQKYITRKI